MKKVTLFILTLTIFISCHHESKMDRYEINGIVKNIPDSSMVILSADNRDIDSAIVIDEKFQLKGKVNKPTNVYLVVKNSRDYTAFWLENKHIDFIAEKGNFRESKIRGSETQKENDLLTERIRPIRLAEDSLANILSDKNLDKSNRDSLIALYHGMRNKELEANKAFIREYPNSLVSIFILNIYKTTWGKETTNELFTLMNKDRQESNKGKSISRFIRLNKNPQVGDKYVNFEQENANGKKIKFSTVGGKYTLLEFWASWCGPCRMSNPSLVKEYKQYNSKGFEILGVSLDEDRDRWLNAIEKDSLVWENVSDLKGGENEVALIYGINGIPDNFLIDEHGIIIGRALRGNDLKKKLEEVFDQKTNM